MKYAMAHTNSAITNVYDTYTEAYEAAIEILEDYSSAYLSHIKHTVEKIDREKSVVGTVVSHVWRVYNESNEVMLTVKVCKAE